jgi:hypothetical protein
VGFESIDGQFVGRRLVVGEGIGALPVPFAGPCIFLISVDVVDIGHLQGYLLLFASVARLCLLCLFDGLNLDVCFDG